MTTTINHRSEAAQAAQHGHELGCFEEIAEKILESLTTSYETGAFCEEIDGMTVLERIVVALIENPERCTCEEE